MGHGARGPGRAFGIEKHKRARSTKILIGSLWKYLKHYIGAIMLSATLIILYSLTSLASPLVLRKGIDSVAEGNPTLQTLLPIILLFFGFAVLGWVLNSISTIIMTRMNSKMLNDVRIDLYRKLSYSDMAYIKNEQSGNITARVTSDTGELATGIQLSTSIVAQLLLIVGSFVILLMTNWIIALISLAAVPIAFLISAVLSYFGRKIVLRVRRAFGYVSGKMAEGLSGIAVAKSFNREEDLATELRELNQQHYKYSKQFGLLMMFVMPSINALSFILLTMIIYASGWINRTTSALSLGDIYLSINLSQQFLFPIIMLAMSFPQLEAALGAMDRIIDIFDAKPAITDSPNAVELQEGDDSVHFKNVSFAYNEGNYVLKNITFSAKAGEMVAVVGHTGAGKTTLLSSLLTRFYDVTEGGIYIGNQNIKDVKQSSLRKAIGLVTQEPFLFSGTVMENILYGSPNATEEDVHKICKRINADEFIESLPDGYNTQIVEGGKKLSSGQKQIITIARTMLADPRILVLDEATSRLDAYTESLIQAAQAELFKGRTTFVIAHRLSTIKDADKIVVLDHGKLVEIGTHEELMEKKGIYADLYNTYYAHQGLEKVDLSIEDLEPETLEELTVKQPRKMRGMAKTGGMSHD
ncbi:MAG: ABC transporter ATP-binding protein, partial [Candidatus Heimdallarchaeaceae archaeon]